MRALQRLLSQADIQAISDFLNSHRPSGKKRYITACAGCHGIDGQGGRVGGSVLGADRSDVAEAIHEEPEMEFLGCLPASDINDIGKWLMHWRGGDRDGDDDMQRGDNGERGRDRRGAR
jgi:mono/diheme cytochrome c family protein